VPDEGNILNLYSVDAYYEFWLSHWISWLRFWWFSFIPAGRYLGSTFVRPWVVPVRFFPFY